MKDKRFKLIKTETSNYYLTGDLKLCFSNYVMYKECSYRGISLSIGKMELDYTLKSIYGNIIVDMNEIDLLLDSEIYRTLKYHNNPEIMTFLNGLV
jgi:hypothetical protein